MSFFHFLELLRPWQFSLPVIVVFGFLGITYYRGSRIKSDGFWHQTSFWAGLLLTYIVLHTKFDYYSQYMFFMHRIQHLVLHHFGPFFICLAAPWPAIMRGLGEKQSARLRLFLHQKFLNPVYAFFQHPVIAVILFAGLIAFWLNPEIHFYAMLNASLYQLMNWSMFIDGLIFWWLILNPADKAGGARIGYGGRIIMLVAISPPQILIGAYITFSKSIIYDIYSVCGRAWPMAPMTDQTLGGLITWIPANMMSVLALIIVLRFLFKKSAGKSSATTSSTTRWNSLPG